MLKRFDTLNYELERPLSKQKKQVFSLMKDERSCGITSENI